MIGVPIVSLSLAYFVASVIARRATPTAPAATGAPPAVLAVTDRYRSLLIGTLRPQHSTSRPRAPAALLIVIDRY
jgi:hypothetical protein